MKRIKYLLSTAFLAIISWNCQPKFVNTKTMENNSLPTIYDFSMKNISGENFSLSSLKGKKVMLVNTASKCGLTPQYEKLEALYQKYKDKNFVIVGFPANNFGAQEPGTNTEIATFCKLNYGVTFPMMEKISVKGADIHPLYQFLTQKSKNGVLDSDVSWNFQKYLINEKGELVAMIPPTTSPENQQIIDWIEGKHQ